MNMEKTVCKEVVFAIMIIVIVIIVIVIIVFVIIVIVIIVIVIAIVMVKVVDAYECKTGIEEGGVKKTIVVCNTTNININTMYQ